MKTLAILAAFVLPLFAVADDIPLVWTPPVVGAVDHYTVYWGTSSKSYFAQQNVFGTNAITITGLDASIPYFFVVTATDANGIESDPSTEIVTWVSPPPQSLLAPQGLLETGTLNVRLECSTNLTNWDVFTTWQPVRQPNEFYRLNFQKR